MGELTSAGVPAAAQSPPSWPAAAGARARYPIDDQLAFLAEAGDALSSSLDVETTLATVAQLAVPRLADWCAVHLVRDDGTVDQLAVTHVDPAKVAWARELQERYPHDPNAARGVANVLRTGQPEIYPEITDELLATAARDPDHLEILHRVGLQSAIVTPLVARGHTMGAITFATAESGRRYEEGDLALAGELARRAALAVDNARLYRASQLAEARYRGLFEGLADAVVVTDPAGHYLEVNQALCDLLGYSREEMLRKRVGDLTTNAERARAFSAQILREGSARGEGELRRKDGTPVPVEVWARQVDLPTGPVNLGVMRDISERKNVEGAHQAQLNSIAHDLKNPLSALTMQAQLLSRLAAGVDAPQVERIRHGLARVEAIARRLTNQVEELQDVARLRTGQPIELQRAPVDLVRLAAQLADEYRQTADRHTIRVETAAPELIGSWDPNRLERVLANLLTNAIKYSEEGEIVVRLDRTSGEGGVPHARVSVQDQGAGIPAADLAHVFEPFHRGANVAGRVGGSGMGLAGVRHIVEQHGGTVSVESREGIGSTFTVDLPIADGDEQ